MLTSEPPDVGEGAIGYAFTGAAVRSLESASARSLRALRISPLVLVYKRVSSIVLSSLLLVITAPLLLLAAIAIRMDSPGPAIFRQRRVGKRGKTFTLFKFRTMYVHCNTSGKHWPAEENDPRITRVGGFLRRSHLDELPQLFNIFRGDMDFVGPRPFVPDQEARCAEHIPHYAQRWLVKPGATGWAQVRRGYCATLDDNAEKLAYDLFYIEHLSIWLDLIIVCETLKIMLFGRAGQ